MSTRTLKTKVFEWLRRYIPAEMFAIVGAMTGGLLAHYFFNNPFITALAGTWGENVGFYGRILWRDIQDRRKKDKKITIISVFKVLRNTVVEFGLAEYFDSLFFRPSAMYIFPKLLGNVALGLLVGKLSADVIFYLPTIIFYELRKKYLRD